MGTSASTARRRRNAIARDRQQGVVSIAALALTSAAAWAAFFGQDSFTGFVAAGGVTKKALPNVHILILYSTLGNYANYTDLKFIAPYWQKHVRQQAALYAPSGRWPFNLTLEYYDIQSNCTLIPMLLQSRFNDKTLPKVTAMIGEGDDCAPGAGIARVAGHYQVPIILTGFNPDLHTTDYKMPPDQNTSLLMEGPTYRTLRQMVDTYLAAGVQTVVAVSNDRYDLYNENACFGSADVMAQRGVQVLGKFRIGYDQSTPRVIEIVKIIKGLNPDAVLWCDWGACALTSDIAEFLPLQYFKQANYLPKAFNVLDCLDSPSVPDLSLFHYLTGGNFVSSKIKGFQYTEDSSLYSSMFRPATPATFSGFDQMSLGLTAAEPSSTYLFYKWYNSLRGYDPSYPTVFCWAAFDVMEKGLYLAMTNPAVMADGTLTPLELFATLKGIGTLTPVGAVQFDVNGVNTVSPSILMQSLPQYATSEIVGPSSVATSLFVYPMPTWADRVYTWTLVGTPSEKAALGIAAACSFVLLTIMVTVVVHRADTEIKMFHYLHVVVFCLCAMCVCWSTALLWQADNIQAQCNGYLWGVFLPASVFVVLVNMKAYRLSRFLYYTSQGLRPRPFTHGRVVTLTLRFLAGTVVVLIVCAAADPPTRTRVVLDPYRPRLDYYTCKTKGTTDGLLYFLVVAHLVQTLYCVAAVRNGLEAFQDGMIIKEAATIFYLFVIIALVLSKLNIEYQLFYILRCAFVSIGATVFCLRLMVNRCAKYWLPAVVLRALKQLRDTLRATVSTKTGAGMDSSIMTESTGSQGEGDQLLYAKAVGTDEEMNAMVAAIMDPDRGLTFKAVATKALVVENVNFIEDVVRFQQDETAALLLASSAAANGPMQARAAELVHRYIRAGADEEVNVSAKVRAQVETAVDGWTKFSEPFPFALHQAQHAVRDDPHAAQRARVFEPALREIVKMLFDNLWTKFKIAETENIAGDEEEKGAGRRSSKSEGGGGGGGGGGGMMGGLFASKPQGRRASQESGNKSTVVLS